MILTIDVGNTRTNFGLFERQRLKLQWTIPTRPSATQGQLVRQLTMLSGRQRLALRRASQIILCSVVPRISLVLGRVLRSRYPVAIRSVGRDVSVPLKNRYARPKQVGQDRLVGAYAAWRSYRRDCIVVDFGTAITIDLVTKRGEYLGGVIAPGPEISLDALAERGALLPRVELAKPPELLGRDTVSSMRSGVLYGSAALCDGLISQLRRRYAPGATVVATGGASRLIAPHCRLVRHVRPHLVLEGLRQLAQVEK